MNKRKVCKTLNLAMFHMSTMQLLRIHVTMGVSLSYIAMVVHYYDIIIETCDNVFGQGCGTRDYYITRTSLTATTSLGLFWPPRTDPGTVYHSHEKAPTVTVLPNAFLCSHCLFVSWASYQIRKIAG